ncbi:hypothetical protein WJX72_010582 [[Myrmecia] bisecta]|uniref:Uncharacterized protein n=1 Tax=[Myrmecia] bisecta TaxID=41462 RepID=A0AAW1Q4S8_9CHLO
MELGANAPAAENRAAREWQRLPQPRIWLNTGLPDLRVVSVDSVALERGALWTRESGAMAANKAPADLPSDDEITIANPVYEAAAPDAASVEEEEEANDPVLEETEASAPAVEQPLLDGWRQPALALSLSEVNGSVSVCSVHAKWYMKLVSFLGVGFMISVGYMDPGNWATDISAGSSYGYTLLSVILMANFAAMFLQYLSLKLGVVAERDLAQACRDAYPKYVVWLLWIMAECAIAATDLAEILGSAVAINLLSNGAVPLWAGVLITGVDVMFIVIFGTHRFRFLEAVVLLLCATITVCFCLELAAVKPNWVLVAKGLIPQGSLVTDPGQLYNAIGILGATVMPHNLYLHSSIIQTRAYPRTPAGKRMAVRYGCLDSVLSLGLAFFVNASILILAAAAFFYNPAFKREVAFISEAYYLLSSAVGIQAAKILFGVALLASGQNSTITGTLSGQIVMEGFLQWRIKPWIRRLITRFTAIIPAAIVAGVMGDKGAGRLLVLSQVILSLTLSFAVIPLVHFTSSRKKMHNYVNGWVATTAGCLLATIIAGLNAYLIVQTIRTGEFGQAGGV